MATKRSPAAEQLRTDAEVELLARTPLAGAMPRQADAMLHELQMQQVEPEMQNESLRQKQITLEESRDRYADLYGTAPVGYLTLNASGLIAEIDLTGAALLGEDRSRLVNSRFANFVASKDQDAWQLHFLHASKHGGKQTCELSLQRKGGVIFEARLDCLPTEAGDTAASLHISLLDITGIKRAIVEDQLGELRLRQLIECAPDAMVVVNAKGIINTINRRTEALFGYAAKELFGQPVEILVPDRLRSAHVAHRNSYLAQVQVQGMNGNADLVAVTKDGREFPVDISLGPLEMGSGHIVVVTIRDITENRRLMTELQASEARMRLAQVSAKMGIYDRDIASGRVHWDDHLRKIWGFDQEDPVTFADILAGIHPDDRPTMQASVDRASDPRNSGDFQCSYRVINHIDGTVRHAVAHGRIFFSDGRAVRSVGVVRDVTEQKLLEKKLEKQRGEMEQMARQQVAAQTAAAIAHELNQPLVAISSYSEAALRMLHRGVQNPEKLVRALEGAANQAQRAGQTLHELLFYLQQGEIEFETVNLNNVVHEALAIVTTDGYGRFHSKVELESDLPPVLANALQISKVLVNLLRNGIEAMRENEAAKAVATITVRTQTLSGRGMAQVTVQDNGPGFDADTAFRIFDPFFTTKPSGMGLGLAISRALIEAHGGQLWVDPEAESGAVFHFTLPFAT